MPTINIHAHCADGEYVLALLEQVNLNSTWSHVEITADVPSIEDDADGCVAGFEAAAHDHDVSDADNDGVPFRMGAGPDEASPHGMARPCTAGDGCLDPFCDQHGFETRAMSDALRRENNENIGMISETILNSFVHLIRDHGYNAFSCRDQADDFVLELWAGATPRVPFSQLPNGSKPWWLVVLWAIQDWSARGVTIDLAKSMLRGIELDARGAVKV